MLGNDTLLLTYHSTHGAYTSLRLICINHMPFLSVLGAVRQKVRANICSP